MTPFPDPQKDATHEAMATPAIGDRFHEMYSFWMYVVAVEGDTVTTMEASPPCEFPKDATVRVQSVAEFQARFRYNSIDDYWIRLADRGNDVSGWLEKGNHD